MAFFTVFFQMLSLIIMIGAGYFAAKRGAYDTHTNAQMSGLIVNVFSPMLMLSSAANAVGKVSLQTIGLAGAAAAGMFLFFILAGMILSPIFEKDKGQQKIYQMMFVFSNLGFIGIPVVSGVLGPEYVAYVTVFMLLYNFVFYTYGVTLMEGAFSLSTMKAMFNPGTFSGIASVLIIIFSVRIPDFILTAVTYLGNIASPMALVAVGFTVAHCDWKQVFGQPKLYVLSAVKLLLMPFVMLLVLRLAVKDETLVKVCLIMFGMPIGNMPLILGTKKGMDCTACSAAIILTTVLCVISIPLLLAVTG